MRPLKVLIVDDEPLAVERLQRLCAASPLLDPVGVVLRGDQALSEAQRLQPDLILLDISMAEMDGMAVAHALFARKGPMIAFTTAFESYAAAAFDVAAVDYLLKPVSAERLDLAARRSIDRLERLRPEDPTDVHIWAPHRGELVRLRSGEIEQVIADRDYVRLVLDSGRVHQLLATIGDMERRLEAAPFLRVHRSCLVRADRIVALAQPHSGAWAVRLTSGAEVRVSRSRLHGVRRTLGAIGREQPA